MCTHENKCQRMVEQEAGALVELQDYEICEEHTLDYEVVYVIPHDRPATKRKAQIMIK